MTTDSDTDSLFTADGDDGAVGGGTWSDMRLLHESQQGWCEIYSCIYRDKRVAIKALKPQYQTSQLHRRLLRKEYAVATSLNHQNIAGALWMEEVPGFGEAILMEYVDGLTLSDYLDRNPSLTYQQIERIIRQLCAAVDYMHSRQTVHCDLKPSNIMITSASAFVKLIDFGMSRGNGFETLDFVGGTKGFTAPENFQPGTVASPAADIYSIGKIIELLDRKGEMKNVWRRCLNADPAKRPHSANEIPELIRKNHQRRKRRMTMAVAAGVAVLGGGLLWTWTLFQPSSDAEDASTISETTANSHPSTLANVSDTILPSTENPTEISVATTSSSDDYPPLDISKFPAESAVTSEVVAGIATDEKSNGESFRARLNDKFNQVAAYRFKEHIHFIDTMTTERSNRLQATEHWRSGVKQDMRAWFKKEFPNDPMMIDHLMKNIDDWINFYRNLSPQRYIEACARRDALKRHPHLTDLGSKYALFKGNTLVVRRFGEDGRWHEECTEIPLDHLDPENQKKVKREAIEKALKD